LRPAESGVSPEVIEIRLYLCPFCAAVFTVLPAFVARHLWRAWKTVEDCACGKRRPPRSTLIRWLARLCCDASQLLQIFLASAQGLADRAFLKRLAVSRTRRDLVQTVASSLAVAAGRVFGFVGAWIHRLAPGVRLM
jgi:hypothetical protein